MKKFMGMTAMSLLAMASTISATPTETLTEDMVIAEEHVEDGDKDLYDWVKETQGVVTTVVADEAIVREEAKPNADILNFIEEGTPVVVSERIDNFYKVHVQDIEGYVYREQLDETLLEDVPYTSSIVREPVEEKKEEVVEEKQKPLGEQIVDYAKQFVGNPYVYGGTSLTNGADCSGFTQQIFKHFGISLERTSRCQYAVNGYRVSQANMIPGDLIFYGNNGYINHVAIYAGDGMIVHAASSKTGITYASMYIGRPIIGVKRIAE